MVRLRWILERDFGILWYHTSWGTPVEADGTPWRPNKKIESVMHQFPPCKLAAARGFNRNRIEMTQQMIKISS